MVVGGSQQKTLDPGFMLLGTRQQGVPVILRELVLPDKFDPVSPSFTVKSLGINYFAPWLDDEAIQLKLSYQEAITLWTTWPTSLCAERIKLIRKQFNDKLIDLRQKWEEKINNCRIMDHRTAEKALKLNATQYKELLLFTYPVIVSLLNSFNYSVKCEYISHVGIQLDINSKFVEVFRMLLSETGQEPQQQQNNAPPYCSMPASSSNKRSHHNYHPYDLNQNHHYHRQRHHHYQDSLNIPRTMMKPSDRQPFSYYIPNDVHMTPQDNRRIHEVAYQNYFHGS
ncbi:unnamed protein product [Schistosoma margrebowiei]|uniref:Uncharacterized protein n=1 Tax=Schistosoma margrebowiei TaxID=48269 RepID=A0A183MEP1_9TREM|nr:unnamed protein product [Schistosoma margrebowiei]